MEDDDEDEGKAKSDEGNAMRKGGKKWENGEEGKAKSEEERKEGRKREE